MEGLQPLEEKDGLADVFINGRPMRVTDARTYFRLKHMASWLAMCQTPGATMIELYAWETWDAMALRIEARLGCYLWHPSHWDTYYEQLPDIPASAPGVTPRTMTEIRAQLRAKIEESDEKAPQYALFL
jgi:hypothetical protein